MSENNAENDVRDDAERVLYHIDWTKVIVAIITATVTLIGTVGTVYVRHMLSSEDTDRISIALESSRQINRRLRVVLDTTGADRVVINQFHNGVWFASGQRYEKITATHETVSTGIALTHNRVKALPITLFEDVLLEVRDSEHVYYSDIDAIPNSGVESLLRNSGVSSVYFFRLNSIDGKYIGVMQVEFVRRTGRLGDEKLSYLERSANAVGAYLSTDRDRRQLD